MTLTEFTPEQAISITNLKIELVPVMNPSDGSKMFINKNRITHIEYNGMVILKVVLDNDDWFYGWPYLDS